MNNRPVIYDRYNPPPSSGVVFVESSMTQQQFRDESDINNIISRYQKTGYLVDPLITVNREPMIGDFTTSVDFHEAQNLIAYSGQAFSQLPAVMRKRFNNDPGELLRFLEDESNREEAVKLGIVKAPISEEPVKVVDVDAGS